MTGDRKMRTVQVKVKLQALKTPNAPVSPLVSHSQKSFFVGHGRIRLVGASLTKSKSDSRSPAKHALTGTSQAALPQHHSTSAADCLPPQSLKTDSTKSSRIPSQPTSPTVPTREKRRQTTAPRLVTRFSALSATLHRYFEV